ncbi:plasma membrane calcium ion import channel Cch1 [Schizosaccharomyces osmophilus]|uniref:Calcium-channel protein CCH1 n=1 Tax=Schizosaccharomyces osmophilus TaxID=2545709 RepID=A0AAF0AVN0_9SCHI|nr:plasma membrane calcium ion import channel Cch1 [Schizosaccharomyces osmophilus]WBW72677.1 plasma membrane calcium ion import channel Cch1 [Schizosaccharomyces osmophilus]
MRSSGEDSTSENGYSIPLKDYPKDTSPSKRADSSSDYYKEQHVEQIRPFTDNDFDEVLNENDSEFFDLGIPVQKENTDPGLLEMNSPYLSKSRTSDHPDETLLKKGIKNRDKYSVKRTLKKPDYFHRASPIFTKILSEIYSSILRVVACPEPKDDSCFRDRRYRDICKKVYMSIPYNILIFCLILTQGVILMIQSDDPHHKQTSVNVILFIIAGFYTLEMFLKVYLFGLVYDGSYSFHSLVDSYKKGRPRDMSYMRHSWNRIDFVSIISIWVMLFSNDYGIYGLFAMLSSFRLTRLLNVTRRTESILRSLKDSSSLLVHVVSFVGFFGVLMAILGVQFFKRSFLRQCIWIADDQSQSIPTGQFCGGYWLNGTIQPYVMSSGQSSNVKPRGYICPQNSVCQDYENPYENTVKFDNFFNSLELIFVIMSSNTFTDLMYDMMDAEYFVSCVFFIFGTFLLTFWLMSFVIAVVDNSFLLLQTRDDNKDKKTEKPRKFVYIKHRFSRHYLGYSDYIWITLIVVYFIVLATHSYNVDNNTNWKYYIFYCVFNSLLAFEMLLRFIAYLPNWRGFFIKYTNWMDTVLAIMNLISLAPPICNNPLLSGWLSIFSIARVYRVVLLVPYTRKIAKLLFSNFIRLLNLMLFLFILLFIASMLSVRLFQNLPPSDDPSNDVDFSNTYAAFLNMYQIFSSENWTDIVYNVQERLGPYKLAWLPAAFFTLWFVFSNNIVLSMFISVIQFNLSRSNTDLKLQQLRMYLARLLRNYNPFQASLTLNALLKRNDSQIRKDKEDIYRKWILEDSVIKGFLNDSTIPSDERLEARFDTSPNAPKYSPSRIFSILKSFLLREDPFSQAYFKKIIGLRWNKDMNLKTAEKDMKAAKAFVRIKQAEYLKEHPKFNYVFWFIKPSNGLRKLCQKLVEPGCNERYKGVEPNQWIYRIFQVFIYACIVCAVALACVTTPIYERNHMYLSQEGKTAWFIWTEVGFSLIFTLEAAIKIIADGFCFTPNAYVRNTWNCIDLFVLVTFWINIFAILTNRGSLSRAFRAFKALRVLRLVNLTRAPQHMFHDVLISGFFKIASAMVVSLSLLIPFALWAKNIFGGQLYSCNDSNVNVRGECIHEYAASPNNWEIWAPRVWSNPSAYNFDSFPHALLILFEIVSLEGWIDVMRDVMNITGMNMQPQDNASSGYAMFFVLFNLISTIYILTLFVAIIIRNYTERSGSAFYTSEQKAWLELKRLIKSMRPSTRSAVRPPGFRGRCYDFSVDKHGKWRNVFTGIYIFHVITLMTIFTPCPIAYTYVRNSIFLLLSVLYVINIGVRIYGLSVYYYFHSFWNIFDVIVTFGSLTCNILALVGFSSKSLTLIQTIFLSLITIHLIPRFDCFDQLFKTVIVSLPSVMSLIATWLVLFITFAIAFNQIFGLTKMGEHGGTNRNFRSIRNALVILFMMSCGEGWNSVMHDYAVSFPNCVNDTDFYSSDCGNRPWAYALFISWNIVSMYIFVNMFITVVFENFTYVSSNTFKTLRRSDFRQFKQFWAPFDPMVTGFIPKRNVARFLVSLRGVYDCRVYRDDFSVTNLVTRTKLGNDALGNNTSNLSFDNEFEYDAKINLNDLDDALLDLNVDEIRKRRKSLNLLYSELMMLPGNVVSFSDMLMVIVLHKVIDHKLVLPISDFIRRTYVLSRLEETYRFEKLMDLIETSNVRRTFLNHLKERKKAMENPFITLEEVSNLSAPLVSETSSQNNFNPNQLQISPSLGVRSPSYTNSLVPSQTTGSLLSVEIGSPTPSQNMASTFNDNEIPRTPQTPSFKDAIIRGSHSLRSVSDQHSTHEMEAGFGVTTAGAGSTEDLNQIVDQIDDYLEL